ncbi:MAG: hypothetical protein IPI81_14835 [Flavobacteriales bacterium]|nr:hypothetical protein [Flavobacteriales bacterium]MCC6938256.1 hypothetical protein [Flavobacteriales bacterium]
MPEPKEHQYFRMEASPYFWGRKASDLRHAAKLLWPECERQLEDLMKRVRGEATDDTRSMVSTLHIYGALLGYSVECLFKGKIILEDKTLISNGALARKIQTHQLKKLARMAKISLSQNEDIFCDQVQRMMETEFRYPVPKSHDLQVTSIQLGGKWPDVFKGLYDRIHPTLNVLVQSRERSVKVPWT